MLGDIHAEFSNYTALEYLSAESSEVLPLTPVTIVEECEKALSRYYITVPERVSVTRKRVYVVIAHLTPADFSLLSDFNEIKEELSIVNGSFVTLGKPIKYNGRSVHVRDTMLLAPGSSKSLASIGKLYEVSKNKIKISQEDLENMQLFLNRDREGFIAYAVRDAVISLIHAC